ncbi:hypothetical protein TNIN_479491 [Trichonephila inaurata madagascariensis]|uniref:Uncharacterized protein n=1 Tax=Trichonephila inaurata madagascariensis TaxID=2747483 RepID=A0A8X6IN90_9ARAC|nr:hypothetical protein TNIN_479491 [Trichonephila inaurata madagascariensis]
MLWHAMELQTILMRYCMIMCVRKVADSDLSTCRYPIRYIVTIFGQMLGSMAEIQATEPFSVERRCGHVPVLTFQKNNVQSCIKCVRLMKNQKRIMTKEVSVEKYIGNYEW